MIKVIKIMTQLKKTDEYFGNETSSYNLLVNKQRLRCM